MSLNLTVEKTAKVLESVKESSMKLKTSPLKIKQAGNGISWSHM